MPISGLVVTFESSAGDHPEAIDLIRAIPEVEIGASHGCKLAIVVDSSDRRRDQEIWNMVQELPGVSSIAVAMVAFDDDDRNSKNESQ